jgi:hypothetical protein
MLPECDDCLSGMDPALVPSTSPRHR